MVDSLSGAVAGIECLRLLRARNNLRFVGSGLRFTYVTSSNLKLDIDSFVEIKQEAFAEVGPPNQRAILTFFRPLFSSLVTRSSLTSYVRLARSPVINGANDCRGVLLGLAGCFDIGLGVAGLPGVATCISQHKGEARNRDEQH
jgi:hypothetical protein